MPSLLDLRLGERLQIARQDPPWKVVRGFRAPGGELLVHLNNVSGGILGGDQLALRVEVAAGANAILTTTGATRVYRARAESDSARQSTEIRVGAGGRLEFLPDPLIPFAGSRYEQNATILLNEGATLLWWETLAPGRAARGEVFEYERLRLSTEIRACGHPIAIERADLEPRPRPLTALARLGPYRYLATLYVCRAGAPRETWRELEQELGDLSRQLSRAGAVSWGVSALAADGLIVRGASSGGRGVADALAGFWRLAKRKLCGEVAVLPRKIY